MEPISKYYYNGKCYTKRSEWPRRIRLAISALFVAFATTFSYDISYASLDLKSQKNVLEEYVQQSGVKIKDAKEIVASTLSWSRQYKVDERLVLAIAKVESNFQKHAISESGAYGIMQVIPVWHKDKIKDARKDAGTPELFNINTNIYLGTRIIRDCVASTSTINKALQCYSGKTPGYDVKVLAEYKELKKY